MEKGISALASQEQLKDILGTLHDFVDIPLQLLDAEGQMLFRFGEETRYCRLLKEKRVLNERECARLHSGAAKQAQALGESYIFTCHANMNHIAFPLISNGVLMGSIIIGPFLMDIPDSTLISGLAENHSLSSILSLELYDELRDIKIIPPARVRHLSRLVGHLLSPIFPAERARMLQRSEKVYQQSRINETIQMYKEQGISPARNQLYEKEAALLAAARIGDGSEAKALLNDLMGYVFFSEGGKLETALPHAIELTTLLSRVAVEGGAKPDSIYELNVSFMNLISRAGSIDDLCYLLQDVVESFMDAMFARADKHNVHIRKTLNLIANNYMRPLTLKMAAKHVGLSPNYLSALFRETVGVTFREHLCRVRIEAGKRLLASTDYSVTDIALAVGFSDQSYFCTAFRRLTGITPGKYRA